MHPQARDWLGLELRVPASTSNLGPGFDFLGLALSIQLTVRVVGLRAGAQPRVVSARGTAEQWPVGRENLLLAGLERACTGLDIALPGLELEVASEIPLARGLGSSGAAIAAGLLLGQHASGAGARERQLLAWGLELEGHPDNTSAALLGGCTLAVPIGNGELRVVRARLSPAIGFVLAWSEQRLATREARAVLPREVAFGDATENPRRLALLLAGLEQGDGELLALGIEDRLHVRYRLPLIAGGARALAAARAAGAWAATISGSGSALVALAPHACCGAVAEALAEALRAGAGSATARVVAPVLEAPRPVHSRA